jgi:transcriptional regulator with XRE-family HTH domain
VLKNPEILDNLAVNLAHFMRKENMTQQELEEKSGVFQSVISRILRRRIEPGLTTVWSIANALERTIDQLISTPKSEESSPRRKILAKSA